MGTPGTGTVRPNPRPTTPEWQSSTRRSRDASVASGASSATVGAAAAVATDRVGASELGWGCARCPQLFLNSNV